MAAVLGGHAFRVAEAERAAALARSHYTDAGVFAGAALALLASALHEGPTPVPDAVSRCKALLVQAETPVWQSFVRPHLAGLEAMAGRFDSARAQLEEAFRGRRGSDDPQTIVIDGAWYAGQVELLAGENERAIEILEPAVAELRRIGDRLNFSTNAGALAEACYRLGRFDEARALSHEAVAASPPDFLYARVRAERVSAKAMAHAGETRQARASIDATLRNVAGCDAVDEHGHVLAAAAEIAELAGDVGERSRFLSESLAMFERKENVAMAQRVRDALLTLS